VTLVLLVLFYLSVGIQLFYLLFIFSRTAFYSDPADRSITDPGAAIDRPAAGVSVVVCAWNEKDNLRELLPLLDRQKYPAFEVLVMDDRSNDGTQAFLENEASNWPHVRFIRINREYEHITPKKYALTVGIRNAQHDIVLVTDADCRPVSEDWITGMVAHLSDETKQIVLGFSPYERRPGMLNRLIRYETLYTAVQYFSLALAGRPYMGVGRNLMYRRALFLANKGFYSHMRVMGGDDDLFMNEVATSRNTTVSLLPETFMFSKPKETFAAWRHQKRRHLSVGKHYKKSNQVWLGLLSSSHIMTWLLGLIIGVLALSDPWRPEFQLVGGLFLLRLLLFWTIVGRISYRLGHTVHWMAIPGLDIALSTYYTIMGFITLRPRRKQTRMNWR